jgi:hypothetical protein
MWGQHVHLLLCSPSHLLKICVGVTTETMRTDNCARIVHCYLTLRSGLSINTAATFTEYGKRICWYTCDLHRTRQAHLLEHLWSTQNTASASVGTPVTTQNTASAWAGTPVTYTEHGKRICWHTCDLHSMEGRSVGTAVTYTEDGKGMRWHKCDLYRTRLLLV